MTQNWRFFQLRQMTKFLDAVYEDDGDQLKSMHQSLKKQLPDLDDIRIKFEEEILDEWDHYKVPQIKKMIAETQNTNNPDFKICVCDFAQGRKLSIEIWIRICYDIFMDELDGNQLRFKFWNYMRRRSYPLKDSLIIRQWPEEWEYFEDEGCMCLEILKIYEQYPPIRRFIAENLNQMAPHFISVDIRRLPVLYEDKALEIDYSRRSWFPKMVLCSHYMLERIYYANSIFSQQLLRFILSLKDIVFPLLKYFDERNEAGTVVNIFGDHHQFIFEVLYSIKSGCGLAMRVTEGTLRILRQYKGGAGQKAKEDLCRIVLTCMSQSDINEEVLKDIYQNVQFGYQAFRSDVRSYTKPQPYLVLMISERKLNVKMPRQDDIFYHQIPDEEISQLLQTMDYPFLQFYSNLLFNKVSSVQQSGGSRKPFFQLMMLMWAYVMPMYFGQRNPSLINEKIFQNLDDFEKHFKQQQFDIPLNNDSCEIDSMSYHDSMKYDNEESIEIIPKSKKVKLIKFEKDEEEEEQFEFNIQLDQQ